MSHPKIGKGTRHPSEFDDLDGVDGNDLTQFQTVLLTILADESDYGLGIKREVEAFYGDEINHGRLYPNLDTLVEMGLVEKEELDQRTNVYSITRRGRRLLDEWHAWFDARLSGGDGE